MSWKLGSLDVFTSSLLSQTYELTGIRALCSMWDGSECSSLDASAIGCKVGLLPIKYFGLQFGVRWMDIQRWNRVLEPVRSRLASWKLKFLSLGGQVVLIRSVLSSIPLY